MVPGALTPRRIESWLVRDRGDGRRGSGPRDADGKLAVTHVSVSEKLPRHTVASCKLETGRTHQIRIHLSEAGLPVCGEKVYDRTMAGQLIADVSDAPRLALHAAELGFDHPEAGPLHWDQPLPPDLRTFVERLRKG